MWDNGSAPGGAGNTTRGLTHSSDLTREGLAMKATRTCSVEDCEKPLHCRGWCQAHHARWKRYGDPMPNVPVRALNVSRLRQGLCSVYSCKSPIEAQGMCSSHYERFTRTGVATQPVRPRRNLSGQRFGLLTALTPARVDHWLCRCDCGARTPVRTSSLVGGTTRSCGDRRHRRQAHATYTEAHRRVRHVRGKAHDYPCTDCGGEAKHWSYDHADPNELVTDDGLTYSLAPNHYQPRCVSCHKIFDLSQKVTP